MRRLITRNPSPVLRGVFVVNILLAIGFSLFLWLFATQRILIGSECGNWWYHYSRDFKANPNFPIQPLLTLLLILPYGLILWRFSEKHLERHEIMITILWFLFATLFQILIHGLLYHISIEQLIVRVDTGSFYTISKQHTAGDFIRNFNRIFHSLVGHGHTNMPGKTLFFHCLGLVASSPEYMGYLCVVASNIGAILVYFITKGIFANRMTALYAMILYSFLPVRIWLIPVLNTVSPVPMLLGLFFLVRYLNTSSIRHLFFLGCSCYLMVFFDPLVLFAGAVFLGVLFHSYRAGKTGLKQVWLVLIVPAVIFLVVHALMLGLLQFDIFNSFFQVLQVGAQLVSQEERPYRIWVYQDLFDFLIHSGYAQGVLLIGWLWLTIARTVSLSPRKTLQDYADGTAPESVSWLAISFGVALLCLDVSGLCRGEAIRLWLFMTPFVQIITAHLCVAHLNRMSLGLIWIANLIQGLLTTSIVEW